ncbi:MAG TPA: hypothetical protein VF937_16350 [Chloroflexota bacterium]
MKARSASLTLYHFEPGHHREVCVWHDQDHKPEVVGTMPHVFISQRWVAPPDLMAARPPSSLDHNGGEYVNLYWSSGSPGEMEADFDALGRRLEVVGRMQPMRYIHRTWGRRLVPVSAFTRPGLELSAEAVTFAPQTSGLMLVIVEILDTDARDAYGRWHESEHMPMILETGVFSGAVKLTSSARDERNLFVALYYTDRPDPGAAYQEFREITRGWRGTDRDFPNADATRRLVHSGMYRPSIGHYEFYP